MRTLLCRVGSGIHRRLVAEHQGAIATGPPAGTEVTLGMDALCVEARIAGPWRWRSTWGTRSEAAVAQQQLFYKVPWHEVRLPLPPLSFPGSRTGQCNSDAKLKTAGRRAASAFSNMTGMGTRSSIIVKNMPPEGADG